MGRKPKGVVEQREAFLAGCKFIVRALDNYCSDPFEVLSIDPARGGTGWCYLKKTGKIKTGVIVPPSWGFSRVITIEKKLRKILGNRKPFVVIEGYALNATFGRESAGELGGVIRRLLYYKKRPLIAVSPLTLKAWVKAKRKDQIMLEILDRYQVKILDNNAADAFILQEVCSKAILLAKSVVSSGIDSHTDVRLFLKNEDYKETKGLKKLFRYQESSLFRLIMNQGRNVEFFFKAPPALEI